MEKAAGGGTAVLSVLPSVTGLLFPQYGEAAAAKAGAVGSHSPEPVGGV